MASESARALAHGGSTSSFDGGQVLWTEWGSGYPVVVSSPAAIPLWYWEPLLAALAARFRAIFVHPRGLGHSELPPDVRAVGVSHHAHDLASVVRALSLEDYAVLGHCIGAAPVFEGFPLLPRRPRTVLVVSARLDAGNATQNLERIVERVRVDPRFRSQYARVAAAYAPPAFRAALEESLQSARELEGHLWAVQSARLYSYRVPWPADVSAVLVTSTGDAEPIQASTLEFARTLGDRCKAHTALDGNHFALLEQWETTARLIGAAVAA